MFEGESTDEVCVRMWGKMNLTAEVNLLIQGSGTSELNQFSIYYINNMTIHVWVCHPTCQL